MAGVVFKISLHSRQRFEIFVRQFNFFGAFVYFLGNFKFYYFYRKSKKIIQAFDLFETFNHYPVSRVTHFVTKTGLEQDRKCHGDFLRIEKVNTIYKNDQCL